MKSTKQKVFSVLSIIFYGLACFTPFIIKIGDAILFRFNLNPAGDIPIALMASMLCSLILGSVTVIRKEHIAAGIGIITCAAGVICTLIFRIPASFESIRWLTSGYLILLLLVLLTIPVKKMGKQKLCLMLQKVMVALLFINIAVNIFIAANIRYWAEYDGGWLSYNDYYWNNIYLEIVLILNSLACVFWGMWYITHGKNSEEKIHSVDSKNKNSEERIHSMNSKNKTNVFSVLSIIFYGLVFFPTLILIATVIFSGTPSIRILIRVMASMFCPLLLGSVTVIRKEHIVTGISIVTCAAGILCTLIYSIPSNAFESISWFTCGYLMLLLLVLLQILGKKTGKQKLCLILRKIIAASLFLNIAANIFIATQLPYSFFGIIWENVWLGATIVLNSLACAFWAMWYITHGKYSAE